MAQPHAYGLKFDETVEHPEHGELTVVSSSEDGWPVMLEDEDGEFIEMFEFEAEEHFDE